MADGAGDVRHGADVSAGGGGSTHLHVGHQTVSLGIQEVHLVLVALRRSSHE